MNKSFSKIIKAGALVGTLDITSAFIYYFIKTGNNPLYILKLVASGLLGSQALLGGSEMLILGLLLHYLIAFSFTAFFFWIYSKTQFFFQHRILTGVLYGLFVYTIMNLIIVPLSKIPARTFTVSNTLINMAILIICIGIPLSLMATKFSKKDAA